MSSDDESDDYAPDSGPFCQHFGDPSDCDERCATCGHPCHEHDYYLPHECEVDGCECVGFRDGD